MATMCTIYWRLWSTCHAFHITNGNTFSNIPHSNIFITNVVQDKCFHGSLGCCYKCWTELNVQSLYCLETLQIETGAVSFVNDNVENEYTQYLVDCGIHVMKMKMNLNKFFFSFLKLHIPHETHYASFLYFLCDAYDLPIVSTQVSLCFYGQKRINTC